MSDYTLGDLPRLLLPDLGALVRLELGGINAVFVLFISGIAAWFLLYVHRQGRQARGSLAVLRDLIDGVEEEQLVVVRPGMAATARMKADTHPQVAHLWREFDETLVESPDGRTLWNTLDAEHFFNSHTLAGRLMHHQLLGAVPGILTAVGVLGTFIGLTTGLQGLNLEGDVTELRSGIDVLVAGASIAFMTSVWGVGLSIVCNLFEKRQQRRVGKEIIDLQNEVDTLFRRHAPEQSLVRIMDSSAQTEVAMQELHEKIGSKLQEAVEGLSAEMQTALAGAINTAMAPSMERLAESAANQSSEVLSRLVAEFSDGLNRAGTDQAERLDASSAALASSLEDLHGGISEQRTALAEQSTVVQERIEQMASLLSQQAELLDSVLPTIVSGLETAAGHMNDSTSTLESSSSQLGTISSTFERTAGELATTLDGSRDVLASVGAAQDAAAENLAKHSAGIEAVAQLIDRTGMQLAAAAERLDHGFDGLTAQQEQFLDGFRKKTEELAATMSEWLSDYSTEVQSQTAERMGEWNKQTREFTSNMVLASEGIQGAVDDLNASVADSVASKLSDRFGSLVQDTSSKIDVWSAASDARHAELAQAVRSITPPLPLAPAQLVPETHSSTGTRSPAQPHVGFPAPVISPLDAPSGVIDDAARTAAGTN